MSPSVDIRAAASREIGWLDRGIAATAVALSLVLSTMRGASGGQWQADVAAVRDQGLVSVGLGGGVSTVVTQAMSLLPLGARSFRTSLGSALATTVACALLLGLTRRLLRRLSVSPRLASLLAATAASAAALSPTWQHQATMGGGAMVAVALALAGLRLVDSLCEREPGGLARETRWRWLLLAMLFGAELAESVPVALAFALVALASLAAARRAPPAPGAFGVALGFLALVVAALLLAPLLLRPLGPRTWTDLGRVLSAVRLSELGVAGSRVVAVTAWTRELGVAAMGLCVLGAASGLVRHGSRRTMAALLLLVPLDLLCPLSAADRLVTDPLTVLRALGVGVLAVASAVGVAELVRFLLRLQVPMARAAAVLLVVFHMTMVTVTCEEAGFEADRSGHFAAEEWTDAALGALPAGAALLVHSPELAWRLWAARLTRGERPDVLVVPAVLLRRGPLDARALAAERCAEQLVRDLALTGQASEFALSSLADARPLHVELDRSWNERLLSHVRVEGPWLRFEPEVLGASDRAPRAQGVLAPEGRIVRALGQAALSRDEPTTRVVTRALEEHAATLALLGLLDQAGGLLDRIEHIARGDPFVLAARLRLAHAARSGRRSVDLRDLLRF